MIMGQKIVSEAPLTSATTLEEAIQQQSFRSDAEKAFVNLLFTASWFGNRFQAFLKPFDLTPQQYNILRILRGQKGNPISLHELKSRMLEQNSDTSRIIDRMVRKGFIDRKPCAHDRRQVDLTATAAGVKLLETVGFDLNPVIGSLHCLAPNELVALSALLDKVRYTACEEDITLAKARTAAKK